MIKRTTFIEMKSGSSYILNTARKRDKDAGKGDQ